MRAVSQREPNSMGTLKSHTMTILFADVADSSRLYRDLGDRRGHEVVTACIDTMSAAVIDEGGRVVDQAGDEIMCVFSSPTRAQSAAIEIHGLIGERALEQVDQVWQSVGAGRLADGCHQRQPRSVGFGRIDHSLQGPIHFVGSRRALFVAGRVANDGNGRASYAR